MPRTNDGSRSWRTASPCSTEGNSRLTPRLCPSSDAMGIHTDVAHTRTGAALQVARRRRGTTFPELGGQNGRTRLVVLGSEVSGRWSEECRNFLSQLAKAKVRGDPPHLKVGARQAWHSRWATLLACCAAARAVALLLLERRGGTGADGDTPSTTEVLADARYTGVQ